MDTTTSYCKSSGADVNISPYKFKRLSHNQAFWDAWSTGKIEGKSRTRVIYKLMSALRWARFTKPEVLHMVRSWHGKHGWRYDRYQLEFIYAAVEIWLKPRMRERKREEMRRYRERKRQQKALELFKSQVVGGDHE